MRGGSRMGRGGNNKKTEYKKGLWTTEEDTLLMEYVKAHGKDKWNRIPLLTGLKRCGKSCRLRWMNYLSPTIKLGDFSPDEDDLIIRLHNLLGNRWSLIAGRLPGRTDNQVKNYWNTHLRKKLIGIKKGKGKVVVASTIIPQQYSIDKANDSSSEIPSSEAVEHSGRGHVEKMKGIEDVANNSRPPSSMEITASRKEISLMENKNSQTSLMFFNEDDSLIVDTRSLLDFLTEYSLDRTWNTKL